MSEQSNTRSGASRRPVRLPGRMKRLGEIINEQQRILSRIRGGAGTDISMNSDGLVIDTYLEGGGGSGLDLSQFALGHTFDDVKTVIVYEGDICTTKGTITVPQTTIIMTGNPCWIYVSWIRGATTATVEKKATKPQSTGTVFEKALARYDMSAPNVYTLTSIRHTGDITLDIPLP